MTIFTQKTLLDILTSDPKKQQTSKGFRTERYCTISPSVWLLALREKQCFKSRACR